LDVRTFAGALLCAALRCFALLCAALRCFALRAPLPLICTPFARSYFSFISKQNSY
jgi:hypothetical protein